MTIDIKDKPALARLRIRLENKPTQMNNSSLPAGSPMFFYCEICGHESDRLPESYTTSPNKLCTPCRELKEVNPELTNATIIQAVINSPK